MRNKNFIVFIFILFMAASCDLPKDDFNRAEDVISTENMARYIQVLASDAFKGRKPLTEGEDLTINYLEHVFREELKLQPGYNGSYLQKVPLMEVSHRVSSMITVKTSSGNLNWNIPSDAVMFSRRVQPQTHITDAELVFAGYGIVAPEYNWNDYQGIDVKDKIVVVLVNDPGLVEPEGELFKGKSMTYYGRWTYKYEEAARQGAKGVLIVHDTYGAGYPWSVVVNGASIPKLYLQPADGYTSRCELEGWITTEVAEALFKASGFKLQALRHQAAQKGFAAMSLAASLTASMESSFSYGTSHNVIGLLPGTDLADEVIVFSAHWDHLGIGPVIGGDSIYRGAVDNGTSLAWMMEIARAFQQLKQRPRRSILFLAPTAEEQGLLGAFHYVENPSFPLNKTIANFNNDLMLPLGRMADVMITGYGQSELDEWVEEAAKRQDRFILPDPNPETGMYYRADHFAFAQHGVPAVFARGNNHHRVNGPDWTSQKEKEWLANNYHKPADKYDADTWDLEGIAEDARLMFYVAWKLANSNEYPQWKEGSEFREIRRQSLENQRKEF
jgi:Zn-dependent M28 family amino/carboxypeptidase